MKNGAMVGLKVKPSGAREFRTLARLPAGDVHIWIGDFGSLSAGRLGSEARPLPERGLDRRRDLAADQIRWRRAAHSLMRSVLATYTSTPPEDLDLYVDANGKPHLRRASHPDAFEFSLSHSGSLAVVAVGRGQIGVDIEKIKDLPDLDQVTLRCMNLQERRWLGRLKKEDRAAGFFRIWTLKEAYLKGLGVGLRLPLTSIEVIPDGRCDCRLRVDNRSDLAADGWTLRTFELPPEYIAAVAVQPALNRIEIHHWREPDRLTDKVSRGATKLAEAITTRQGRSTADE